MNALAQTLSDIAEKLADADGSWALVGGLAVSSITRPRFTADVDLAVAVENDSEAERIVRHLMEHGYRVAATVEQDKVGRLATVRLIPPGDGHTGMMVDILFASSGIEREIVLASSVIEIFDGVKIPTASTGHLLALKILSRDDIRRPQDASDIRALLENAGDYDLNEARNAIGLITARGFHRDRDLRVSLEEAIAQMSEKDPK